MPKKIKIIERKKINSFIQPKRRLVRQRSGFNVSGGKTGSESYIHKTSKIRLTGKELHISSINNTVRLPSLFSENISFFGVGLYVRTNVDVLVTCSISLKNLSDNGNEITENKVTAIPKNNWFRVGIYLETKPIGKNDLYRAETKISILSKINNPVVEIFGFQTGAIDR